MPGLRNDLYTIVTSEDSSKNQQNSSNFTIPREELVQISPFFEMILRHECKETLEHKINLTGCSTIIFEKMIDLVHNQQARKKFMDHANNTKIEDIEEILDVANLYQVSKIIKLYLSVALFNNVINRKSFICLHSFSNR